MPSLLCCAGQAAVRTKYDVDDNDASAAFTHQQSLAAAEPPTKLSDKSGSGRRAVFLVKMASSSEGASSGGALSADSTTTGTASSSSSEGDGSEDCCAAEGDVWFDCEEALLLPDDDDDTQAAAAPLTAEQRECLQALPSSLCSLLTKYLQGATMGCKPLVAVLRFMQDTSTSLAQLQALLQPLLDAEQHLPQPVPVPVPRTTPAEYTAALRQQLQQQHNSQQQRAGGEARVSHLLRNVQLSVHTLEVMSQQEGFKQVSHGPLEMWYCHDTAAKSQSLRARVVLDEPVSVVAAVAREADLVPTWNAAMADLHELATYSPTELLTYLLAWMPWPLLQPEMVNYCFGADLLDLQHGCVLLHTSGTDVPAGVTLPQHARTMPIHMTAGGFRLVPLPPAPGRPDTPRTEVTVLATIDAARLVVPDSIITCVLKVFAPLVHKSVLKVLARMFHQAAAAPAAAAAAAGKCHTSLLLERLAMRPEYAALDAHAAKHLAAAAAAAAGAATAPPTAAGDVQPF